MPKALVAVMTSGLHSGETINLPCIVYTVHIICRQNCPRPDQSLIPKCTGQFGNAVKRIRRIERYLNFANPAVD